MPITPEIHFVIAFSPYPLLRETVEVAVAASADQVFLRATLRHVRRVPRVGRRAASHPIRMANHGATHVGAGPVAAWRVTHLQRSVRVRARQDVVLIRLVANAVDGH